MRRLRIWIVLAGLWLTFFFNLERIMTYQVYANLIQSETYIFVAGIALITLLFPKMSNPKFSLLLAGVTGAFLVNWYVDPEWEMLVAADFPHLNAAVVLLLIQVSAIVVTGLIARQIAASIAEFEDIIADITFRHLGGRPKPFSEEQSAMYQEVRRANRYGRPLSIIAVRVDDTAIKDALPKMVEEVQQAMMKEFTLAGIARVLHENTYGFDLVALSDDNFVVMLPETTAQDTPTIVQRLQTAIQEKLGITVQVGAASMSKQAVTFDRLLEIALEQARRKQADLDFKVTSPQKTISQEV